MKLNIKDLTEEQIKDLELQLQDYRKPKEPHYKDVKSWEDAFMVVKPEWYHSPNGVVYNIEDKYGLLHLYVPSQLHAKSILATCKLMVIADALNEGWKPDWEDYKEEKWTIYFSYDRHKITYNSWCRVKLSAINFKSKEIAIYAMKQFEDLFLDMLMIER